MTTLKDYPYWGAETERDLRDQLRQITNIRKDDITQFSNLTNIFLAGRTVGKIPSSSTDVSVSDRLGDQSNDADYLYILVNDSGTPAWRRVTLGTW